jgi:hypothetical protein
VRKDDNLTTLTCWLSGNSGSCNLPEPYGHVQRQLYVFTASSLRRRKTPSRNINPTRWIRPILTISRHPLQHFLYNISITNVSCSSPLAWCKWLSSSLSSVHAAGQVSLSEVTGHAVQVTLLGLLNPGDEGLVCHSTGVTSQKVFYLQQHRNWALVSRPQNVTFSPPSPHQTWSPIILSSRRH